MAEEPEAPSPDRGATSADRDASSADDPTVMFATPSAVPRDPWLAVLDGRSHDPAICPFLRAAVRADSDGQTLGPPVESPDTQNRCAALREPVPQSLRQQELVCLTSGHVDCPRYLRGAVVGAEPIVAAARLGRTFSPAILGSIVVLVAAFAASIAFVTARGGLAIEPATTRPPSASAVANAPGGPSAVPSLAPMATIQTPDPTPPMTAPPTPAVTATPGPSREPTAAPTPAPTVAPTRTPRPTSDRYQFLEPCPDASNCWIYTVRAGDNLTSIANYFGVSIDSIYDRNPWARTTGLRAGQELRLPPPTR